MASGVSLLILAIPKTMVSKLISVYFYYFCILYPQFLRHRNAKWHRSVIIQLSDPENDVFDPYIDIFYIFTCYLPPSHRSLPKWYRECHTSQRCQNQLILHSYRSFFIIYPHAIRVHLNDIRSVIIHLSYPQKPRNYGFDMVVTH